jgi:predicted P-loop ATPase
MSHHIETNPLVAEAAAITDWHACYSAEFIGKCAAASDDVLFFVRQTLRKIEGFGLREFDRKVKEERLRGMSGETATSPGGGWKAALLRNEKGTVMPNLANSMLALRHAPEWQRVLAYNQLAYRIDKRKKPPYLDEDIGAWNDTDDSKTAEWLQLRGINVKTSIAAEAANVVAHEHSYHPVREYLTGLKWDGKERISRFLIDYFQVEDAPLNRLISRRWLISGAARAMKPGCQVDTCLVLEGGQGKRKSTTLRALAVHDEWFADQIAGMDYKDSSQDLQGKWIIELSEIDKFSSKHEQGTIKSFIPRMVDHFRQSYGHRSQDWPRSCVFAASTNRCTWARDETGGRRWWPVRCGDMADIEGVRRDRDQIWAEAYHAFLANEKWWFDETDGPAILADLREEQKARFEPDPWEAKIMPWIHEEEKKYYEGRRLLPQDDKRRNEPFWVTSETILEHCLSKLPQHWTDFDKGRITRILAFNDFERSQRRLYDGDGVAIHVIDAEGNTVNDANGQPKQKRDWAYRRVAK